MLVFHLILDIMLAFPLPKVRVREAHLYVISSNSFDMATAVPVGTLLVEHPTNPVEVTDMVSQSNKAWAEEYLPISRLTVHTHVRQDGAVIADFDTPFLPAYDDENLRLAELAYPPNSRQHRLYSEQDAITWFHSEISNIVLPAFTSYPPLVQTGEPPPVHGSGRAKQVDMAYTAKYMHHRTHVAVGEFKRNLILYDEWQENGLSATQRKFSRELRGYAYMYECPHIFSFDQANFLMLQFRANSLADIRRDCEVDCWILPRVNPNGTSIREALYRLLVQGFRRFQGQYRMPTSFSPDMVEMFSGQPLFLSNGVYTANPNGCTRLLDTGTGSFYWVNADGDSLTDANGDQIWDTLPLWE